MSLTLTPDPVLPDVLHILPQRYRDARGWFCETYNDAAYHEAGLPVGFVQDNQSYSAKAATLRGLHFQLPPHAQAKLVRCLRGRILDVAVDLRIGSPNYGRHTMVELSADSGLQVFVPEGFAHGFCTLEDGCEVAYKVNKYYAAGSDAGVAFDDPDISIKWPFSPDMITVSDKDRNLPPLKALPDLFFMQMTKPER